MSISQAKKKIETLRSHLGSDTIGLELLDGLKAELNELRHDLSAAEKRADESEELKKLCKEKLELSESSEKECRDALRVSESKLMQCEANLAEMLKSRSSERQREDSIPTGGTKDHKEHKKLSSLMEATRKDLSRCPKFYKRYDCDRKTKAITGIDGIYTINISDLIPDLSTKSLITLGRVVALIAAFSPKGVYGYEYDDTIQSADDLPDKLSRKYVQWLIKNIDRDSMHKPESEYGFVRVHGCDWKPIE